MDYRAMPMVVLGGGASILARHVSPRAGLCGFFTLEDDKRNAQGFQRLGERMLGVAKEKEMIYDLNILNDTIPHFKEAGDTL